MPDTGLQTANRDGIVASIQKVSECRLVDYTTEESNDFFSS
jgi:hypothetical protein